MDALEEMETEGDTVIDDPLLECEEGDICTECGKPAVYLCRCQTCQEPLCEREACQKENYCLDCYEHKDMPYS